jgi:hypothetical protein
MGRAAGNQIGSGVATGSLAAANRRLAGSISRSSLTPVPGPSTVWAGEVMGGSFGSAATADPASTMNPNPASLLRKRFMPTTLVLAPASANANALTLSFRINGPGTRKLSGIDRLRHPGILNPDYSAQPNSGGWRKPGLTWRPHCGITPHARGLLPEKAAHGEVGPDATNSCSILLVCRGSGSPGRLRAGPSVLLVRLAGQQTATGSDSDHSAERRQTREPARSSTS